ncbi:ferredoxin [Candidatus Woesearchaeota archaeon]|nr:ferredoxin [Candidatus Woesearchaeota archaeon]
MVFKISVDEKLCIGCGACEQVCDNFRMKNGLSEPVKKTVDELGCNEKAKDVCPVDAILIEEN